MNRFKIRLSDKTHSKPLKEFSYFSIKSNSDLLITLIPTDKTSRNFLYINEIDVTLSNLKKNRNELAKLTKYY